MPNLTMIANERNAWLSTFKDNDNFMVYDVYVLYFLLNTFSPHNGRNEDFNFEVFVRVYRFIVFEMQERVNGIFADDTHKYGFFVCATIKITIKSRFKYVHMMSKSIKL